MKKIAIAVVLALTALFCFAGCSTGSGNTEHTHTYASTWSYDENKHWHAATCEHTDLRSEEAAHTLGEDGKCTVCSYKMIGMTVAEFTATHAETGRDYARSAAKILATNFNESAVLSEFVWFQTNDKNFLTGLTYLYTASRSEGQSPAYMTGHVENSGFSPVDLEEVAGGKSAQMGIKSTTGSLIPYDKDAQAGASTLAAKVVATYCTATGETVSYGTPLLRLFHAQLRASDGGIDLRVLDVFESGYTYYIVNVAGTENELSDNEALAAKLDGVTKDSCKKNGKTDLGTLVYKNING